MKLWRLLSGILAIAAFLFCLYADFSSLFTNSMDALASLGVFQKYFNLFLLSIFIIVPLIPLLLAGIISILLGVKGDIIKSITKERIASDAVLTALFGVGAIQFIWSLFSWKIANWLPCGTALLCIAGVISSFSHYQEEGKENIVIWRLFFGILALVFFTTMLVPPLFRILFWREQYDIQEILSLILIIVSTIPLLLAGIISITLCIKGDVIKNTIKIVTGDTALAILFAIETVVLTIFVTLGENFIHKTLGNSSFWDIGQYFATYGRLFYFRHPENSIMAIGWRIAASCLAGLIIHLKANKDAKDAEDDIFFDELTEDKPVAVPQSPISTMQCPQCHAVIPENSKFCGVCGQAIPQKRYCVKCGNEVFETDKFCPKCGTAL